MTQNTTQKRISRSGFIQFKEEGDAWKFYISSFDSALTGEDGFCNVLHTDGLKRVPIDKTDRLLIEGKKYGRKNWSH